MLLFLLPILIGTRWQSIKSQPACGLLQTLADAWKDRTADPWTQKSLTQQSPKHDQNGLAAKAGTAAFYIGSARPADVSTVLATTVEALRDFTCHPDSRDVVSFCADARH